MTVEAPIVSSLADRPDLRDEVVALYERGWPAFMGADPVDVECYPQLLDLAPEHQLVALDGTGAPVGSVHLVPLRWREGDALPDEGWDWAFATGIEALRDGRPASALVALAMTIDPDHRGQGLAGALSRAMLDHGRGQGCSTLIIPLRPSGKADEPLAAFPEYVARRRPDGLPFDPWIRAQVRAGARLGPICWSSMRIRAPIAQWIEWTGVAPRPGEPYVVPQALVPVDVEGEGEGAVGVYREPNVWVVHVL